MKRQAIAWALVVLGALCALPPARAFTLVEISPQTQGSEDMQAARKIRDFLNRELNVKDCGQCRLEIKVMKGEAEIFGTADSAMLPAVQSAAQKVRAMKWVKKFDVNQIRYAPLAAPQAREEKTSPQGVFKAPAGTSLPAVQQPGREPAQELKEVRPGSSSLPAVQQPGK